MRITESRLRLMIIEEMALNEVFGGETSGGNSNSILTDVKSGKSVRLAERVVAVLEGDPKDHFVGSTGSKYEMSAQGTYISHVPSMQEDEEDKDEDNRSESLKTRERMITIVR